MTWPWPSSCGKHLASVSGSKWCGLAQAIARVATTSNANVNCCKAADRLGLRPIASTAAHFATPQEYEVFRLVTAVRQGGLLDQLPDVLSITPDHHLVDKPTLQRRFHDLPDALSNLDRLTEQLSHEVLPRRTVLPPARVPRMLQQQQYLRLLCARGLHRRGLHGNPPAHERLGEELAIIDAGGLAPYFLVVRDIARHARHRRLTMALRGSAGNSLVCYLLEITDVNPLQFNLALDRFLHIGRPDLPDIDLDFDWRVRDEVINHVFERYGPAHTAMISTHLFLQPRSAFREAGKIHGLSNEQITLLAQSVENGAWTVDREGGSVDRGPWTVDREGGSVDRGPWTVDREAGSGNFEDHSDSSPTTVHGPRSTVHGPRSTVFPPRSTLLHDARLLLGRPRHLSVHPGGIVITPQPIEDYVPVQRAAKGVLITQFEKDAAEATGLVKIDLLGNRALANVDETLALVEREAWTVVGRPWTVDREPWTVEREAWTVEDEDNLDSSPTIPDAQRSTVHGPRSTVHALPPTVHGPRSTVHALPPTVHGPRSTVHALPPTVHGPRSTVHALPPTVHGPRSTVHGLPPTVHGPRSTVHDSHDDAPTLQLLQKADTLGVNQLESPAMRHLLMQLRPRGIDDIVCALALIRPGAGAIGMKGRYIQRRCGGEPVPKLPACLEPVLRETYGLLVYQDDALGMIRALTGLSIPDTHRFYKRATKVRPQDGVEFEEADRRLAEEFRQLCLARGIAEAVIAEQWLLLTHFRRYTFCKSHAVSYALIAWRCAFAKANHPLPFWTAVLNNNQGVYPRRVYVEAIKLAGLRMLLPCVNHSEEKFTPEKAGIRTGLGAIATLPEEVRQRILDERGHGPYRDLADFRRRVQCGPEALAVLIRSGSLDFTGRARPGLFLEADLLDHAAGEGELFEDVADLTWLPTNYDIERRRRDEWQLLGFIADRADAVAVATALAGGPGPQRRSAAL